MTMGVENRRCHLSTSFRSHVFSHQDMTPPLTQRHLHLASHMLLLRYVYFCYIFILHPSPPIPSLPPIHPMHLYGAI